MFQISFKFKFAAVKALNFVHIEKKDYEHVDKYHDILVCQNLRAKSYYDIFDEIDIFKIFKNWEVFIDESLRVNLKYFRTMSNKCNVIKNLWNIDKIWFDVIVAMLFIHLNKKIKICNSSNKSIDDFILKLIARVEEFWAQNIAMTKKKFVRVHASIIEHQIIVKKKNFELIIIESNFERRRWRSNEISTFFYNKLIHEIIDVSKQTKHDRIYDRHYKIHEHNIDTFLLEIIKLKNFIVFSMQIKFENIMIFVIDFLTFQNFEIQFADSSIDEKEKN